MVAGKRDTQCHIAAEVSIAERSDDKSQLAGAVVRLGADEGSLERDARSFGADVLLLTPDGDGKVELRAITPERSRQATIHFRSPADGRRRALLSGLDLLRRALLD